MTMWADMSYRGWQQAAEDHAIIVEHPEIFSSFTLFRCHTWSANSSRSCGTFF